MNRIVLSACGMALLLVLAVCAPVLADDPVVVDPSSMGLVLGVGSEQVRTVQVHLPAGLAPARVDIYLLADTTYSMASVIESLQNDSEAIVDDVMAEWPRVDLAFGVGSYCDFVEDTAFSHQLDPCTDPAQVRDAIDQWSAAGGYDVAEAQFYALHQLALDRDPAGGNIGWREDAKRVIVWFGDAPGHDPICDAISGLGYDIDEAHVTADLQTAGVTVVAVSTGESSLQANRSDELLDGLATWSYLDHDPQPYSEQYIGTCDIGGAAGQATRIGQATGGRHVVGRRSDVIVTTIRGIVADQIGDIALLSLEPQGTMAENVADIRPPSYGPLDGMQFADVSFDVVFRGRTACQSVTQTLTGTLDVVADGAIIGDSVVTIEIPPCPPSPVEEIPEPTSLVLLLGGLGSMAWWLKRRHG